MLEFSDAPYRFFEGNVYLTNDAPGGKLVAADCIRPAKTIE